MLLAVPLLQRAQLWGRLAACCRERDPAVLTAMYRGLGWMPWGVCAMSVRVPACSPACKCPGLAWLPVLL